MSIRSTSVRRSPHLHSVSAAGRDFLRARCSTEGAIAHFLYNLLGVVVIYGIPWLRRIPMAGAEWIARLGSERNGLAVAYILSVFFGVPGSLVLFSMRGCPEC